MAITINTQPDRYELLLAYRPLVYEFSSDDVNIVSCVVEVLANDVRVAVKSVQPDLGTTDEFTVDISSEVQKQLSSTLVTLGSNGIITDANNLNNFRIKIYEVTEVAGVLTTAYNPADASNSSYDLQTTKIVVANWTESHVDYNSFTMVDYYNNDALTDRKFLSESPLVKEIELGQNEFLGIAYYTPVSTKTFSIEVLTYDSTGALLNTDTIALSAWVTSWTFINEIESQIYYYVGVGTQNLINEGISLTNVAYYTVQLVNTVNNCSELRRYNIVDACDTDTRIHWFNRFGKQESLTFKGNKIETVSTSTSTFEKALGNTYSSSARGTTTIQTTRANSFEAYTKSVGREIYQLAQSIAFNNNAYVELDDAYFPIIIDDIETVKVDEKNMPIQFKLSYRLANRDKGIRG